MDDLIDTRQLRTFLAVARTGSFTSAAKRLHLTQSAVSHAIRVLEESLECRLIHRNAKQVLFTRHGRELLKHAEGIEHRMKQARGALRSLDGSPRGTLRIGCTTAASQFILPDVLREFKESFPQFEIKVLPGESPAVLQRILADEVDMGLIIEPADTTEIDTHFIFEDEVILVVAPGHPWAGEASQRGTMEAQTFIISTRQSYTWQLVAETMARSSRLPQTLVELGSNEATKELAMTGYGIGVCAGWTVARELISGQLLPVAVPGGRVHRKWVSAILKGRSMSLAERTFLGLCREAGRLRTPSPALPAAA